MCVFVWLWKSWWETPTQGIIVWRIPVGKFAEHSQRPNVVELLHRESQGSELSVHLQRYYSSILTKIVMLWAHFLTCFKTSCSQMACSDNLSVIAAIINKAGIRFCANSFSFLLKFMEFVL